MANFAGTYAPWLHAGPRFERLLIALIGMMAGAGLAAGVAVAIDGGTADVAPALTHAESVVVPGAFSDELIAQSAAVDSAVDPTGFSAWGHNGMLGAPIPADLMEAIDPYGYWYYGSYPF